MKKRQKLVKLVKAETPEEQKAEVSNSDIVIFACGYQTEAIPILDSQGTPVPLKRLTN